MRGANTRVRPILMTAVATILALSPVALGFAHGSIIAAELAIVVIGGLFTSTFLTLMVIPVIYSLVDGGKEGFRKRFMRGERTSQADGRDGRRRHRPRPRARRGRAALPGGGTRPGRRRSGSVSG